MLSYRELTVGDRARLGHEVAPPRSRRVAFKLAAAEARVWEEGSAPGAWEAASAEPAVSVAAEAHVLSYLWEAVDPGRYRYQLRYTLAAEYGGDRETIEGELFVWPEWSVLDRYLADVRDALRGPEGGALAELGRRELADALARAVDRVNVLAPRQVDALLTRPSGQAWFDLPDGAAVDLDGNAIEPAAAWLPAARVVRAYPVGDARWTRTDWLTCPAPVYRLDAPAGRLYLDAVAAALQLRLRYALPHVLDHSTDTLGGLRPAVVEWAAGWLLATPLANVSAQTNEARGSDVVSHRDMQQRRKQQGESMMLRAEARMVVTPDTLDAATPGPSAYTLDLAGGDCYGYSSDPYLGL
jgi:hypothetical protein